jgi:uncharacterized protein
MHLSGFHGYQDRVRTVTMRYVLNYRAVEDFMPLAREHGASHVARLRQFHSAGTLLMVGTLREPMNGDALGVFTTREAAEDFVSSDPFVLNGVVESWSVRPWEDILSE